MGAPQAQQVADRWHLLHSLWEAVERFLRRQHRALRSAALGGRQQETGAGLQPTTVPPPLTRTAGEQAITRERRQARNQEIQALFATGMPIAAIARHLGLTRPTVRRSLVATPVAQADPPAAPVGLLTPYEPYLWQRWQQGCRNAKTLWQEIQAQGYEGSCSHLRLALSGWRTQPARRGRAAQHDGDGGGSVKIAPLSVYTPRQATSLLCKEPTHLTGDERAFVARLHDACPQVAQVQTLAQAFHTLVRTQEGAGLGAWVAAVAEHGSAELRSFARGLQRDWSAVLAGLSMEWNNGMSEGFVNKTKTYKRAMYGRANLDLLRLRVLLAL